MSLKESHSFQNISMVSLLQYLTLMILDQINNFTQSDQTVL